MPGVSPMPVPPMPGSTPGQMPLQSGAPSEAKGHTTGPGVSGAGSAMGAPRAGGDYPPCTRDQLDGCRQPQGRKVPPPQ